MFQKHNPPPDEMKSQAYLVYSEWGPDSRIPRDERLAACFPSLPFENRAEWMATFDAVEKEIWAYAETGGPRLHPFDHFAKHMIERFPFMNNEALRRAGSLAMYYTVHEGY